MNIDEDKDEVVVAGEDPDPKGESLLGALMAERGEDEDEATVSESSSTRAAPLLLAKIGWARVWYAL